MKICMAKLHTLQTKFVAKYSSWIKQAYDIPSKNICLIVRHGHRDSDIFLSEYIVSLLCIINLDITQSICISKIFSVTLFPVPFDTMWNKHRFNTPVINGNDTHIPVILH